MAYNQQYPPFYYGAPAMPYMPQFSQPQPQQPSSNVNWAYVNGLEGARNQIVQPGQISWMMDNNDAVIYVKAVDNMGSATLKCFKLIEFDPNESQVKAEPIQYATKDEVDRIKYIVDKLSLELGGVDNA